jgi:hypothetical protein
VAKRLRIIFYSLTFQVHVTRVDHSGFPTRVRSGADDEVVADDIFDSIVDTACSVGRRQGSSEVAKKWVDQSDSVQVIINGPTMLNTHFV